MAAALAKTLATERAARRAGSFSSALSRFSLAPTRSAPMIRCYSISPSARSEILAFGCCNYFEKRSGGDRRRYWRPFGLISPLAVQHGTVAVTEIFGKLGQILYPGIHWLFPFVEKVISVHPTDEIDFPVDYFWCTTKDKASVCIRGLLCCKVVEPLLASVKVAAPFHATLILARHKLIAAVGKVTLSKFLAERNTFTQNLLTSINAVSLGWGIETTRFDIKDLSFPVKDLPAEPDPFINLRDEF